MDSHTVRPLYDALHRYAGWLDRERAARQVRADVAALGTALDASDDPLPHLQALDAGLARLPSGELKNLLRTAAGQMRRELSGGETIPITPADVRAIVRSVIITHRLPFAILAVTKSSTAWNIIVRAGTGGLVRFAVAQGQDLAMRIDIRDKLEAEL